MMRLAIVALTLFAAPLAAQITAEETITREKCDNVTVSNASPADIGPLVADAECYARRLTSAASSQRYRLEKAKELALTIDAQADSAPDAPPLDEPVTLAPSPDPAPGPDQAALIDEWTAPAGIPASAAPDTVGAFRITCNSVKGGTFDPLVYPGVANAGHRHRFYSNPDVAPDSTYASLRKATAGSCHGGPLNGSSIWGPELMDGRGNAVLPSHMTQYYKMAPDGSDACPASKGCVGIPDGLVAIFGFNYVDENAPKYPAVHFRCYAIGREDNGWKRTLGEATANCSVGETLYVTVTSPSCWKGPGHLDSPNHQDHLAYPYREGSQILCPETHPYGIEQLTITQPFPIEEGDDPTQWAFSSDIMAGAQPGTTFHFDYMEGWNPDIRRAWQKHCIQALRNCSGGILGDGRILERPPGFTFDQRPHLIPMDAMDEHHEHAM
ncbi:MAG: DUF1996 domain-containing protein [Pontixanthobacter sp.]